MNIRSQAGCKYTPLMGYDMKPSSKPLHSQLSRGIQVRGWKKKKKYSALEEMMEGLGSWKWAQSCNTPEQFHFLSVRPSRSTLPACHLLHFSHFLHPLFIPLSPFPFLSTFIFLSASFLLVSSLALPFVILWCFQLIDWIHATWGQTLHTAAKSYRSGVRLCSRRQGR